MGRPKTEQGPTPDKVRQSRSLAELRKAGGDKVAAKLPPESFAALKRCQLRLGTTTSMASITETLIAAIDALDAKLTRAASRGTAPIGSFGVPMDQTVLARNPEGRTVIRRRKA